jgi:uncharacterized protein (TIGR00255 family)
VIRSMTGFAAVSREEQGQKVAITAKSVNHRFLDLSIKSPQSLSSLEGRIRAIVQQRLTRGRLELIVTLERSGEPTREVVLNEALLERLGLAIEAVRAKGLVTGALTASDVLRLPQVLEIRQTIDAAGGLPEEVAALVEAVLVDAIDALVVMRETEGRFLRADLDARMQTMAGHVDAVEREAREGQRQLHDRLRERLADLPVDLQGDPAALAQEVVRFVARSDVDEELVRLRAHFDHWRELADGPEPCGRKLDFLVQEMNREINTIGSKAEGGRATEIVVSVKAELERIREQVQNVE